MPSDMTARAGVQVNQRQLWVAHHFQNVRVPADEQARMVRQNFRAYAQLPPWKRRMLRRRWLEATPEQRAHMRERLEERREHIRP